VLQTFEPRDPGAGGGGRFGGGASLSMREGLNHMTWNLQTTPPPTFPGMILWGARMAGPRVPPGTYTVRITADGGTETTELEVAPNPWITDVTVADMRAQFEFGREILAKVTEANTAVIEIRRAKVQLAERLEASDDGALAQAG